MLPIFSTIIIALADLRLAFKIREIIDITHNIISQIGDPMIIETSAIIVNSVEPQVKYCLIVCKVIDSIFWSDDCPYGLHKKTK